MGAINNTLFELMLLNMKFHWLNLLSQRDPWIAPNLCDQVQLLFNELDQLKKDKKCFYCFDVGHVISCQVPQGVINTVDQGILVLDVSNQKICTLPSPSSGTSTWCYITIVAKHVNELLAWMHSSLNYWRRLSSIIQDKSVPYLPISKFSGALMLKSRWLSDSNIILWFPLQVNLTVHSIFFSTWLDTALFGFRMDGSRIDQHSSTALQLWCFGYHGWQNLLTWWSEKRSV